MRTIVIALVCAVALATQGIANEIDAEGCRTFVVAVQLRDLVAEPVEFDSAQLNKKTPHLAVESSAPDLVVLTAPHWRKIRSSELRQHRPPIYKLDLALLI
ncbi:MAG: hypothetical protein ACREP5_04050 [Candidatus Binatia bacterium]